ncbi:MAG: tetratricopeptide repeat protein, partial [Gammaproteobacteria bacterium]|nr:tetratricopeptide repeat protein [Gammaproteobacteria bacterium]
MTGAPLLTFAFMAAIWPFNRDRDEGPDTIEDLESRVVVSVDTAAPIEGGGDKAIESYRRFLELSPGDPALEAEATRRLADLQLESAEKRQLDGADGGSDAGFRETVQLYEQLLDAYPGYARNDRVLYQLARAYEAAGEPERALATLDRLVGEYPDTPRYDEAEFRRGEILFAEQRFADAERAYASVLGHGTEAPFFEQSLYKHAWALFKQARHEASLASFFLLLDRKLDAGAGADPADAYAAMGRADQELVDDAFRAVSIAFSYLDGPDAVAAWFDSSGRRPYEYVVYTQLGNLYLDQERYQDAADAYGAFADADPYHRKAPLLEAEVVTALGQGGFADLVLDAKREFVERYGAGSPYWERYSFDAEPEVVARLKSHLTDLAAHHHAAAQQTQAAEDYAAAAHWYRTYLAAFPDGADAAGTNFLLAELLFDSGSHRDAALEYERTAYAYPYHERSAEAGYAALLAYATHEAALTGADRAAWRRAGIESALRFAAAYPEHEQAAAVETDAAEKLFAANELLPARDAAMRVVSRPEPPAPELQRTAWTVVAHVDFELGRFADAEAAYARVLGYVPAADAARGDLVERLASSIYKQGEQAQAAGDDAAAVEHFLRVGRAAPRSGITATAEYDAAAALIRLESWSRAAAVLEGFRQRYPDHELSGDVAANLAVAYLESGDALRAAAEFERIADDGAATEAVRREALWRAAELYADGGQRAAAAGAFERYVERFPSPAPEAVEARQRLADLAGEADDYGARMRWLEAIVAADAAAGAERTDRTRYLAAKAQLALADPARNAFRAVALVMPLAESLELKRRRMEQALDAYGKAAAYGVADVTTAATYEIAELYHELGRALLESERPPELDALEREQYDILLEEQAFPFEEQAIEVHERNAARTADGVYDEWV